MSTSDDLHLALEPLLHVLAGGRNQRLVARPGFVEVDRPEGAASVAVAWDEARHAAALALVTGEPARLADGVTVVRLADALVLRAPPPPLRRVEELAREGRISSLAARALSAALTLGRNILVVGPYAVAADLLAALLAEGRRAAVVGNPGDAVPPAWPLLTCGAEALAYGADRIGAWSLGAAEVHALMSRHSGVVAWIDARRLDRALIRFEAALNTEHPAAPTPLQILAALDLVVVVSEQGGPRVTEVAEIDLVEDGYRPRLLFAAGLPPVPTALVPVGRPSFLAELDRAGMTVLADELRHAVVAPSVETPVRPPLPSAVVEPSARRAPSERREAAAAGVAAAARAPRLVESTLADPNTTPGWELDRGDADDSEVDSSTSSPDDAVMAAAYGLGPPPRPAGVRPLAESRQFEDALRRAREREGSADDESQGET